MEISTKRIGKWDAMVCSEGSEITIAYMGTGGAIISGSDRTETENKWIEAMGLAEAVKSLLSFKYTR